MHALTTPLITKADGTKFGKTEGGAVWLDPEMTSPYAFYQFWLNTDDADVVGYLQGLHLPHARGDRRARAAVAERPAAREAQRALAARRDDAGARRRGDRQGRRGEPGAVRPRRAGASSTRRRSPPPSRSCRRADGRRRATLAIVDLLAATGSWRARRRPAGDRRGRRVGQQRAGARRGRGARPRTTAARPVGRPAPRQADARRGRAAA